MLPPFIIEQIRQREEEKKRRQEDGRRPALRLPIPGEDPYDQPPIKPPETDENHGVIIIPLDGDDEEK
ncbi:MAG: hypothetical protein V1738_06885 [Patescibacteria group bacterium]